MPISINSWRRVWPRSGGTSGNFPARRRPPGTLPRAPGVLARRTELHLSDSHGGTFKGTLFRYPGQGGWTFVAVPQRLTPPVTHGWGRTPVHAVVDGQAWDTSVWRDTKSGRTLLAVPKHVRGEKGDGDRVTVSLTFAL